MQRVIHSLLWRRNKNPELLAALKKQYFQKGFPSQRPFKLFAINANLPTTKSIWADCVCGTSLSKNMQEKFHSWRLSGWYSIARIRSIVRSQVFWGRKCVWASALFFCWALPCLALLCWALKKLNRKGKRKKEWVKKLFLDVKYGVMLNDLARLLRWQ